jgi:hypothetical protein
LKSHYPDFTFYYSGTEDAPTALLLDRKDDGVRPTGNGWYPIEGKNQLDEMVDRIRANYRFWGIRAEGPRLTRIVSPHGTTLFYLSSRVFAGHPERTPGISRLFDLGIGGPGEGKSGYQGCYLAVDLIVSPQYASRYMLAKTMRTCIVCGNPAHTFGDCPARLKYESSGICEQCQERYFKRCIPEAADPGHMKSSAQT